MKQRDSYDGSGAPFQGNVVLRLRSIPVNARIVKATATITPVSDKGGSDPFTEVIAIANHSGDFGATEADTVDWVEVDFHTRRTLAAVAGSHLTDSTLQVDVGGGTYVDISQSGGFLTPTGPPALKLAGDSAALPSLGVAKLKLTNPTKSPRLNQVTIRSVPSNLSLAIGDLAPVWKHVGEMPRAETSPDFAAVLQSFLAKAKVENGSYIVPFTLHSDTLARLRVDLDIEQVSQAAAIPKGLKEVVQPFDFSSLPQPQADVLKVEIPANARVIPELTAAKVKGGFAPTRVVLGPTGPVSPAAAVEVSTSSTAAQPFTVPQATGITGIDLLITCTDPTVSLQADIRADLAGKPDNPPLFRGPVDVALGKKSAGESQSFWASVSLPAEFYLEAKTYWLVLQSLNGTATWDVTHAEPNSKAVMQRSQDGGFSWRLATPQPQTPAPAISGPLAAFFRLRRKPDKFQVPIDLLVGAPPAATRIPLHRFAPLGRVDFAPSDEVTDGFNQYLQKLAAQSPHVCPQGEQLANGDFAQWLTLASDSTRVIPVDAGTFSDGTSVVVAPDGKLAYFGVNADAIQQVQAIDTLCDRPDPTSEIDFGENDNVLVAVSPNGSRLYALIDDQTMHLEDISGDTPATIGRPVDIGAQERTTGIVPSPDGARLYFAGPGASTVTSQLLALDTAGLEQAARSGAKFKTPAPIPIGSGQATALALSPDGSRLCVGISTSGIATGELRIIDTGALSAGVVQTIKLTFQPSAIALTPDGKRAVVVGPPPGGATTAGVASIVDLASQLTIDVPMASSPVAVVISPDGQRAFVALTTATGGSVSVVDLSRARTTQAIDLDATPVALAINPQGDRVYIAKNTANHPKGTAIGIIAFGSRVPSDWMLTSGSVKPDCLTGSIQTVALLGHVPAAGDPVPPANGLSQMIPAAACPYDFSFWGLSNLEGAVGEVLWLDGGGQLLKADQLPIQVWRQPAASPIPSPTSSPLASPTPSPSPEPELQFEEALAGPQPPVLHRVRLTAPAGVAQAEVRFTVPSGGVAGIGLVSLAGTSQAVTNSDLQILQNGFPVGWTLTPPGAAVSVSSVDGGVQIQNGGAATAALVQTATLTAKQKFTLEMVGGSQRLPQAQQNPSVELHWLKQDGTPAGPATILEIQPQDFDRVAGGDSVPDGTTRAEVHLVVPPGTSLTVRQLAVESFQTTTVPVSFIAQSPGELTTSDLRVAVEKVAPPNPSVPAGGLATPTAPGPSGKCQCPCCGDDRPMAGASSAKTPAGRPATVGACVNCGTTVFSLGGSLVAGARQLPLPILYSARKARPAAGPQVQAPRPTTKPKQPPLTAIPGIGKQREQQLKKAGILSIRDLAAATPEVVAAALTGVSLENAPHFIDEARRLLEAET